VFDSGKERIRNENDPFKKDINNIQSSKETSSITNKIPKNSNKEELADQTSNNLIKDFKR
jgi:hypothetical protein